MSQVAASIDSAVREDVLYLTLSAPPLNILTIAIMDALSAELARAASDRSLKAVVLQARGKAFSAGADIGEHSPDKAAGMIASFGRLFDRLDALEIPIVMAVDGPAL